MNLLPQAPEAASNEPLYNIGVVTRMTGISMATLRAWERRYDFPQSDRTSGGHRLYSEHDILRLKWVKERIEDGLQTSHAIQALRHQEESGEFYTSFQENSFVSSSSQDKAESSDITHTYTIDLVQSLVDRQLGRADQILGDALASSSPENLILNIIGPAMAEIGDKWEQGQISVVTEHLATNYLRQKLLMWMISGPPPLSRHPIVLACAPNEWHEGSLLILGALLRRRRWPVIYLGQSVPLKDLGEFVKDTQPAMVVLVAMTELSAGELSNWPQFLPEAANSGKPLVAYGGRVFNVNPEWRSRIPGTFLGETINEGILSIEKSLQ